MREEVIETAKNSRLNLSDEEVEGLSKDFEEVLDMFETLQNIDTEGLEPSFHPIEIKEKLRDDNAEESIDREEVFRNTENVEEQFFKGPSAR